MKAFKKLIFCLLSLFISSMLIHATTSVPFLNENRISKIAPAITELDGTEKVLTTGWYLASGTLNYLTVDENSASITIDGDVHLILEDGCNMTVLGGIEEAGINVTGTNSLTVYAQSTDAATMGKLKATGGWSRNTIGMGGAGIGGCVGSSGGIITINGGDITAICSPASTSGAGIGGGSYGDGGTITINGGIVNATGRAGSYGSSAGIGGGSGGSGGNITISGGTVNATSPVVYGPGSAGIGGGLHGDGGTITITGGIVNASGSGAGIGGGKGYSKGGNGGNITISGGTVAAFCLSSHASAGIGGGACYGGVGGSGGASGNILIYGENTKVNTRSTGNPIGAGFGETGGLMGATENIFAALPKGNLKVDIEDLGNQLMIGANPASSGTVTVTLPAPFDKEGPISLITGPTPLPSGKIISFITTMSTHSFALDGYANSPVIKSKADMEKMGADVNFIKEFTGIPYIDENGNFLEKNTSEVTVLTGSETELTTGWYLAIGAPLRFSETLNIDGNVHLILGENCSMVLPNESDDAAINIIETSSLTIYAQSTDASTRGKLLRISPAPAFEGVFIGNSIGGGTLTINGGEIYAPATYAGISVSNVIINNGKVSAFGNLGENGGPGIGGRGGRSGIGESGGNIIIRGGEVFAEGSTGIGGGCGLEGGGSGGNITISGGYVIARGSYGAGIGGGFSEGRSSKGGGSGGDITITGGNITASSGTTTGTFGGFGAGIGGGGGYNTGGIGNPDISGGSGGNITISGGNITAFSLSAGAGIGGGSCFNGLYGSSGNILIYGENTQVTAKSDKGQDIGSSGKIDNIFVALPQGHLLGTNDAEIGNPVKFSANPESSGIVKASLPAPFIAAGPFNLLTGLSPKGKTLSVITTMETQNFALAGYANSPILKTNGSLMTTGASVDFVMELPQNYSAKWIGEGKEADWSDAANWEGGVIPGKSSDIVYISDNIDNFPVLSNPITFAEVHFAPHAQIGGQSNLNAKAFVQYDLSQRNRWHMLSIPLGQVYPGDFTFGGYPSTWIRTFKAVYDNGITKGAWVTASGGSTGALSFGDGFMLWLNEDNVPNIAADADFRGLRLLNNTLELPLFQHQTNGSPEEIARYKAVQHSHIFDGTASTFYNFTFNEESKTYNRVESQSYTVTRNNTLAFELAGKSNISKTPDFAGGFALIGNPFMAALDFKQFSRDVSNSGTIKDIYHVWTDAGYASYSCLTGRPFGVLTEVPLNEFIAPLQGFIVEKNEVIITYSPQMRVAALPAVQFNETMTAVKKDIKLRASEDYENILDIVARNPVSGVRTLIAKRDGGQIEFGNLDSRKIINDVSNVPEIYTLKQYKGGLIASAVNIINSNDILIPLGLSTSYAGNITLTFSGMNTYDANVYLIDGETDKTFNLTGLASYEHIFNYTPQKINNETVACEGRFFIRIFKTTTGLNGIVAEKVNVYDSNGLIRIVTGVSNLIKEVAVYDLQGVLIYKANAINTVSHTINRNLPVGVYIVKVISEKNIDNVKLIKR